MGFFALVPYGVFMAIVRRSFRPEGLTAHRRMAILTPLCIALGCCLIIGLFNFRAVGWAEMPTAIAMVGAYPLVVGYFYAVLAIVVAELSAAIARRRRRRAHGDGFMEVAS
jgi:uncharacterized membrane protein